MSKINNILYGGPEEGDCTQGTKSLGEFILNRLIERGDDVVLIDAITGKELTASQLRYGSIQVARCLLNEGIKPGDKISISAINRFEFVYVLFGTLFIGATLTPLNVTYSEREINYALNLSKPKIIFAAWYTVDNVISVAKQNTFIQKVVSFDDLKESHKLAGVISYTTFLNSVSNHSLNFTCQPQDIKNTVGLIIYSSGTTGLPKGVQLSQLNMMSANFKHS